MVDAGLTAEAYDDSSTARKYTGNSWIESEGPGSVSDRLVPPRQHRRITSGEDATTRTQSSVMPLQGVDSVREVPRIQCLGPGNFPSGLGLGNQAGVRDSPSAPIVFTIVCSVEPQEAS